MLTYCKESEKGDSDVISYEPFDMYVDKNSIKFLEDAKIDHNSDTFGGQLTIKAPNSKVSNIDDNSTSISKPLDLMSSNILLLK